MGCLVLSHCSSWGGGVNCANKKVKRRGLLVASRQRACLLDVETSELQAGQSKAYAFQVGPYDTGNGSSGNVGINSGIGDSSGDNHNPDSKNVDSRESDTSSEGPATETLKVS